MRPIDKICRRFGVETVRGLDRYITSVDQQLMKAGLWDYKNSDYENNKLVRELRDLALDDLTADEKYWVRQIIWFWYHHAVSCALFKYSNRTFAQIFAVEALKYYELLPDHPNKITPLLYYLVFNRFEEAEHWVQSFPLDHDEAQTAVDILMDYHLAFCLKV
ncbi:MAG: hypothetical protein AAB365_03415 [Patescibacteria group bacterium]